jgi:cytochrome d ubiquinol oxidase subunit I
VMSISALYLLLGRHRAMARRSMAVAASFGLASALSVVVLGDESGYTTTEHQKMKLAAMEAMWETEPAPADFTLFAIPDQEAMENHYAVKVPYALGLIATRSLSEELPGIRDQVALAETRIRSGIVAYETLLAVHAEPTDADARIRLAEQWQDLGYALLLKRYREDVTNATDEEIALAAMDTVPRVQPLFWAFRVMVGLGFYFIAFFAVAFWLSTRGAFERNPLFLKAAVISLPLPWIAAEAGWFVAEYGRQPWVIEGVLPTFYAVSDLSVTNVLISLIGFVVLYTVLAVIEVFLLVKTIKAGPEPEPEPAPRPVASPVLLGAEPVVAQRDR